MARTKRTPRKQNRKPGARKAPMSLAHASQLPDGTGRIITLLYHMQWMLTLVQTSMPPNNHIMQL